MKKILLFVLAVVCMQTVQEVHANLFNNQILTTLRTYGKNTFNHFCSKSGMQDLCAAYCLSMAISAIHELGHALAFKLFYNNPINITLGTHNYNKKPLLKFGGFKLAGLNPLIGITLGNINGDLNQKSKLIKSTIIFLSGPVFGAIAGGLAYLLVSKKDKFHLTKGCTFAHVLLGLEHLFIPGSDVYQVKEALTNYFCHS